MLFLAFSSPAVCCRVFRSRVFQSCSFDRPAYSSLAFSVPLTHYPGTFLPDLWKSHKSQLSWLGKNPGPATYFPESTIPETPWLSGWKCWPVGRLPLLAYLEVRCGCSPEQWAVQSEGCSRSELETRAQPMKNGVVLPGIIVDGVVRLCTTSNGLIIANIIGRST